MGADSVNFEQEIKDLITLHDLLKKSDDFYYSSYLKSHIQNIKWKLRQERNLKKNEQSTERLAESNQ